MIRFINNFRSQLIGAADAVTPDLKIPTADAARLAPLLDLTNYRHQLMLTLDDGINIEVIAIDEAHADTGVLYAYRGIDGTTARAWPSGTPIEARLTGAVMRWMTGAAVAQILSSPDGVLTDANGALLLDPTPISSITDGATDFSFA